MSSNRPHDWERRLLRYLAAAESQPFAWGYHDCVLFAAGWLRAIGYPDPLEPFAPWRSPLGAARVIHRAGDFSQAVGDRLNDLGCQHTRPLLAQRGDLVEIVVDKRRRALGICIGTHVAAPGLYSLQTLPILTRGVSAWKT